MAIVQIICGALFIGMGLAMIYLKSSYVELTYKRQCQLRKNVDKEKWCKTAGRMATIFRIWLDDTGSVDDSTWLRNNGIGFTYSNKTDKDVTY